MELLEIPGCGASALQASLNGMLCPSEDRGVPFEPGIPDQIRSRRSRRQGQQPLEILLVEDEALVALDLYNALLDGGYETVGIVASEEAAVQKALELKPDLVVMDIKLKNAGDGVRAGEQIVAVRNVPILYITALRDDETVSRIRQLRPTNILFKPFNRQAFLAAVDAAFGTGRD